MGYVEAINNDNSGIGLTFEKLLKKEVDSFPLPDFENTIEIKTKLAYSKTPIHLFKLTPDGSDFYETKRLLEKYGYYKANVKKLNVTVYANKTIKVGSYHYSLKVNYKEGIVNILIFNNKKELIDNSTFWKFDKLENALLRKLKYLALIGVWPTQRNGIKYYKYYRYDIYLISNFYTFLDLLNKGIISITISMDEYTNIRRKGQFHDHGTSFDISKDDLEKLFFKIL